MVRPDTTVISAFTLEQAAKLTGLSKTRLRKWAKCKFFIPQFTEENFYSFRDLVCLKVLGALRDDAGVALAHLKEVKDDLSHLGDDLWMKATLFVLNKKVVIETHDGDREMAVTHQGVLQIPIQFVNGEMEQAVRDLMRRGPDTVGKIERNRKISANRPVVAGTRIPVSSIKAFAAENYTPEQILQQYPSLTREDIEAAVKYDDAA